MANKDQPTGFVPFGRVLSSESLVAGGTIYPGDLVKLVADGDVEVVSASDAACGVALSYATAGEKVLVADHPNQKFIVQADESDINVLSDINLNYDVVATAGNSDYKISRMELDSSTGGTTATLPLKLLAIVERPDNAYGAQVDCVVKINNHQLASGTGTAGV